MGFCIGLTVILTSSITTIVWVNTLTLLSSVTTVGWCKCTLSSLCGPRVSWQATRGTYFSVGTLQCGISHAYMFRCCFEGMWAGTLTYLFDGTLANDITVRAGFGHDTKPIRIVFLTFGVHIVWQLTSLTTRPANFPSSSLAA